MRSILAIWAALGLCACAPTVPDSGAGVGFGDYGSYLRAQAAAKSGQNHSRYTTVLPPDEPLAPPTAGFSTAAAAAAIAKAEGAPAQPLQNSGLIQGQVIGAQPVAPAQFPAPIVAPALPPAAPIDVQTAAPQLRGVTPQGIKELSVNYAANSAGVSAEQDFEAVSALRSIETDKEQIERNRAQYQIDQPTAVPQRTANVGPSIFEYALATQHPVGVKLFRRSPFRFKNPQTACAVYDSEDSAQEAFLAAGGPDRDRLGIDPDGDGYACGWDPFPFRAIAR